MSDIDIDVDDEGMTIPPPEAAEENEAPASMRGVRRLIAVGGGRGGVGKSQIAVNLAVYFAQLGKSVILIDADATGSNLHAHFGLSAAREEPSLEEAPGELRKALVPTSI